MGFQINHITLHQILAQVSIHPKLADFSVKDTIKTKGSKKELGPPEPDGSASTAVENTEAPVNFTLWVLLVQFSACQFACFSSVCFLCLCICCTSRSDVSFICGEKPLGSKISIFILNHYPAIRWHI